MTSSEHVWVAASDELWKHSWKPYAVLGVSKNLAPTTVDKKFGNETVFSAFMVAAQWISWPVFDELNDLLSVISRVVTTVKIYPNISVRQERLLNLCQHHKMDCDRYVLSIKLILYLSVESTVVMAALNLTLYLASEWARRTLVC